MPRPKKEAPNRKDGLYEVKITVGKRMDGTLIRKSFYSAISKADARAQAEAYRVEQRAAEITGTVFAPTGSGFTTWGRIWLKTYKQPNVDPNTYRWTYENTCEKHIFPYFAEADLRTIQPADIQAFLSTKRNLSESMLDKIHMCLIGIFDSAIENEKCYRNPARSKHITYTSAQEKSQKQVYTREQIQQVSSFCDLPEITALLYSGMRIGELCGLMWTDLDLDRKVYSIQRSIAIQPGGGVCVNPPKWGSYRTSPLEPEFHALLQELEQKRTSPYVFPNRFGGVQNPNSLREKIYRHLERLPPETPKLTPHEMRHTYGTDLRRRGVDIYSIQKIMGHKDLKMTSELYVHNEVEELKRALHIDGPESNHPKEAYNG